MRSLHVTFELKNNSTYNGLNCAFELIKTYAYCYVPNKHTYFGISEVSWTLRALFVFFYLHVLHLMECTVLVIIVLLLLLPSLLCCRCLLRTLVSSRLFPLVLVSYRVVACFSLCTRKFFFHSVPYALVSQSLFALLSLFGTEVARNFFPDSLVLGRFMRVLLSRASFEVDYQSSREDPFQSVDHQRPLKSHCKFTRSTSQFSCADDHFSFPRRTRNEGSKKKREERERVDIM